MRTLEEHETYEAWRALEEIRSLFLASMRRHRIDERWLERSQRMVFDALCLPLKLGDAGVADGLFRCQSVRELEFLYPIPERDHPLLSDGGDGGWAVERGYYKGFVDYTFRHDGLTYFADWKSDRLASYGPEALEKHVALHYERQARIYAVGIVRLLGIRNRDDYENRFGGLLYLFLRGMATHGRGVYFRRPRWAEIQGYERMLMEIDPSRETRP